jgi:hypothetical protein
MKVSQLFNEGGDESPEEIAATKKMTEFFTGLIKGAGTVKNVFLYSFTPRDLSKMKWSAIFSDELGALRVYHYYGGSRTFGTRKVKKIPQGWELTNFEE